MCLDFEFLELHEQVFVTILDLNDTALLLIEEVRQLLDHDGLREYLVTVEYDVPQQAHYLDLQVGLQHSYAGLLLFCSTIMNVPLRFEEIDLRTNEAEEDGRTQQLQE
jgi:hypothetical protein